MIDSSLFLHLPRHVGLKLTTIVRIISKMKLRKQAIWRDFYHGRIQEVSWVYETPKSNNNMFFLIYEHQDVTILYVI